MLNEKLKDEVMNEGELDNVTGGATGNIYYRRQNGNYIALKVTGTFQTRAEGEDAYNHARDINPYNIQDGVDGRFTISKQDAGSFEAGMRARGYNFVNFDSLKRK